MMFRKGLLVLFLGITLWSAANGQSLTVETYSNQLLFNVFKDQPDTVIRNFLRAYVPSLLDKKAAPAEAGSSNGNKSFEIHSFLFTKHPFFKPSFTSGKMEFYCQHFAEPRGTQVYEVKLWFEFDTQEEAEMAYSKLIETFIPISTSKNFTSSNGYMKAEFSDSKASSLNKIQFRLTADNLDKHRFKILFETTNNL